jgi:TIR domain
MTDIFISYRRQDTEQIVASIYNFISEAFGPDAVFVDTTSISAGEDFRHNITSNINQARIMLVVIGKDWFGEESNGARRIDRPNDPVRVEIQMGLERVRQGQMLIIPLLIDDARMPGSEQLPSDLQELAVQNAEQIHSSLRYFKYDINRLLDVLAQKGVRRRISGPIENAPNRYRSLPGVAAVGVSAGVIIFLLVGVLAFGIIGIVAYKLITSIGNNSNTSNTTGLTNFPSLPLGPVTYQSDTLSIKCSDGPFIATLNNHNSGDINWRVDRFTQVANTDWATISPISGNISANENATITIIPKSNLCALMRSEGKQLTQVSAYIKSLDPKKDTSVGSDTEITVNLTNF